jgi:hypothetical protein
MALELPVGSVLYFDISEDGVSSEWSALSEHNRASVSVGNQRIEKSQRMSNGLLRKIFISDKKTFSTSWSMIPTYSSMTIDGNLGAGDIRDFYLNQGQGAFQIKISYSNDTERDEILTVVFTEGSFSVVKRNVKMDPSEAFYAENFTAAFLTGSVLTVNCSNNFVVGEKVSLYNFYQDKFNVSGIIVAATATSFSLDMDPSLIESNITQAYNGTGEIVYISDNSFSPGDIVTITGLTTTAFNLTNAVITDADDYFFSVESAVTGTAATSTTAKAKLSRQDAIFSITAATPNSTTKKVTYTAADHQLTEDDIVSITSIRPNSTITGAAVHATGKIKYTTNNTFVVGDYVNISGMKPDSLNKSNAAILERTATYIVVANTSTDTFRRGGTAKSILNVAGAVVESVTSSTFTISLPNANGLPITAITTGRVAKNVDWSAKMSLSPQEFWDVSISLEEV